MTLNQFAALPLYKQGQMLQAQLLAMQAEATKPVPVDTKSIVYGRPTALIALLAKMVEEAKTLERMG